MAIKTSVTKQYIHLFSSHKNRTYWLKQNWHKKIYWFDWTKDESFSSSTVADLAVSVLPKREYDNLSKHMSKMQLFEYALDKITKDRQKDLEVFDDLLGDYQEIPMFYDSIDSMLGECVVPAIAECYNMGDKEYLSFLMTVFYPLHENSSLSRAFG